MTRPFTANTRTVAELFSDDYVLTVPQYHRTYAWPENLARAFLEDLLGAFEDTSLGDDDAAAPYFLGCMVMIKSAEHPHAVVVDGQHRLVALTLLLAVILTLVQGEQVRDAITGRIGRSVTPLSPASYRLTVQGDSGFFQEHVQQEHGIARLLALCGNPSESVRWLQSTARLFMDTLATWEEARLARLVNFIFDQCCVVSIETCTLNSAYRASSVINTRGSAVRDIDIFRSYILGGIPATERKEYAQQWDAIEDKLGKFDMEKLFDQIALNHCGTTPRRWSLELHKYYPTDANPKAFMDEILLPMAQAYEP